MIIIYSHPNRTGHCGYILEQLEKQLKISGKEYTVWDLYQMNFDPLLKNNEHYTSGHTNIAPEIKILQNKILTENEFVFIYPIWWSSTPAILKGFFDRVFTSHYAFEYRNNIPVGLLKNKKATIIATSGGPAWFTKILAWNTAIRNVTKGTLNFCGIKAKGYLIGSATKFTIKQKRKIEKLVIKLF